MAFESKLIRHWQFAAGICKPEVFVASADHLAKMSRNGVVEEFFKLIVQFDYRCIGSHDGDEPNQSNPFRGVEFKIAFAERRHACR